MFESVLADVVQQLLHLRDFDNPCAPECVQGIVGKATFAQIAAHFPRSVIGRESSETHLLRLDQADHGSKRILLAHGSSNDLLKIHLERTEEMLGEIRAME